MTTVRYPARAAQALGFLKSHNNDIDIFVEDTAAPGMWLKLLRKFIPAGVRLKSVTPLGGRDEVVRACKADQTIGGRKRLYIIDADFDLLNGKAKPNLKHLYRLRRYCVENYLISQEALAEVLISLNPKKPDLAVKFATEIDDWIDKNEFSLQSLFTAYAVSEYLSLGIQTVKYSCHRLFRDRSNFDFCPKLVSRRVLGMYRKALLERDKETVRSAYITASNNAKTKELLVYCSAKSYIIPAIYERAKISVGISVSPDIFKTLLCDHADTSIDPYFRRRLASL